MSVASVGAIAAGAATIAINEAIFVSAQTTLTERHVAFEPDAGTPHDITSQAITLELFREQFVQLADVMQLYHDLVAKDIQIIQKAHDNITDTDAALSAGAGR